MSINFHENEYALTSLLHGSVDVLVKHTFVLVSVFGHCMVSRQQADFLVLSKRENTPGIYLLGLKPSLFATDQVHGILGARVTVHHTEALKPEGC